MRYLLMYNPVSGRKTFRKKLSIVKDVFSKTAHELTIYESKKEHDLKHHAEKVASDFDVFLVAGGDGTINEVVNGIMQTAYRPIVGVLPGGTANDTAAMLGIPKNLRRALRLFLNEKPVDMDINQINDRYFTYTATSGVLSKISYDVSRRHIHKYGYLAYVFAAMRDMMRDYHYPVKITYNKKVVDLECAMVLGLASRRVGGLWLYSFSPSKINDGLFEIRVFERKKTFKRFRLISFFLRGDRHLKEDHYMVASKFKIETTDEVKWTVDGEYGMNGSVEIIVHKQALPVYVSRKSKERNF